MMLLSVLVKAYLDNFKITGGDLVGWPPATDLDDDGIISWGDIAVMSVNWLIVSPVKGDLNDDGIVNFKDFSEFAQAW